ncbi:MAG: hypothetical protein AB9866_21710 [Syntrophobacteraceae bacterium]
MEIYLHGNLKKKYGAHFSFNVATPAEAVRAFQANFGDFYQTIRPGRFKLIRGDKKSGEKLTLDMVGMQFAGTPLHIVPVPRGSKNSKGIVTVLIGVALIAASVVTMGAASPGAAGLLSAEAISLGALGSVTAGQLLMLGATLALGGIMQMLTPVPKVNDYSSREEKKISFLFNGAINRTEQGGAIPIIYGGPIRVGSILVSGGIRVNETKGGIPLDQLAHITVEATGGADVYRNGKIVSRGPYFGINPDSVEVTKGSDVKFEIKVQWPYFVADVLVDNVSVGAVEEYTFLNIQGDHTLKAMAGIDPGYIEPPPPEPN